MISMNKSCSPSPAGPRSSGVELLVVDDGWFVGRNSDTSSLGDWSEDPAKLPRGLAGLAEALAETGLALGLWIEPEMVSPASELYRRHPDWCLHQPTAPPPPAATSWCWTFRGRMCGTMSGSKSTLCSKGAHLLPEVGYEPPPHRGGLRPAAAGAPGRGSPPLYAGRIRIDGAAFQTLPAGPCGKLLGRGGRFDFGMLHYSPQIWASDDTDALERAKIQYGTSYCYPLSCMGCHVSAVPNHQTGRVTSLKARGDTALWGQLGYEMDLALLTEEEKSAGAPPVRILQTLAPVLHAGAFYRLPLPGAPGQFAWGVLSGRPAPDLCVSHGPGSPGKRPRAAAQAALCRPRLRYRETSSGCCFQGTTLRYAGVALPPPRRLRHHPAPFSGPVTGSFHAKGAPGSQALPFFSSGPSPSGFLPRFRI